MASEPEQSPGVPAEAGGSGGSPLPTAPPSPTAGTAPSTPGATAGTAGTAGTPGTPGSGTELRHVSVLFCDLVGFTPMSESRDPEEVRDLLSGYFDLARAIVGRYGGIIQKFIGDAVMAVWGAPLANEDDAERAVRAALELLSAVPAYGIERSTDLQARVGIVTGGAATTETAEEGLVIGDRVNTAARIQSTAPPGTCYVDEATRDATAAAIAYVDAGEHSLKGKSEPLHLFQATRVVAAIAGSQRSGVLEAPFSGRDHELRLVKELFHASAERRSARLVLVSGVAGVGKSRLAWEFFKYIDGLAGDVLWHAGRCLSYGEGVSYWALSEMVRARLLIGEDDPLDVVAERLRSGLERWIPDPGDREFIAPRIGQLLGLPVAQVLAREELFSGWRLFFERLSEHLPVVMVVEDLQWADAGMVDFLDHLLEWSGDHAIFLLVLTRPDGTDRGGLVLSRRSLSTLSLDPLGDEVIGEMLDGLVPDLPGSARGRIVERAEGIPLYAVETVRSLVDKGVLAKGPDGALHLVGQLGTLEIPPGLTALIASRLDSLSPEERRVVKECSVLGESFPRPAVEAVTEMDPAGVEEILSSLVRKEVLTVRADKLSPERGQYAFTQSLIRSVAYDMLSRAERKARHLRTAEHLRSSFPDGGAEVAEVIAAHLYDAYQASGDDPDAEELRRAAKSANVLAAERAESIGAPEAAEAAYLTAAGLSLDDLEQAQLRIGAGRMALFVGQSERALGHIEAATSAHVAASRTLEAASATTWVAIALQSLGRGEQAAARIRHALDSLEALDDAPEVVGVIAALQERLGLVLLFSGHLEEAAVAAEQALRLAEHYELTETLVRALSTKADLLSIDGRVTEARIHYDATLEAARRLGLTREEIRSTGNLADLCMTHDFPDAEEQCQASIAVARRWGARGLEANAVNNLMYVLLMAGRFEEALQFGRDSVESVGDEGSSIVQQLHARIALIESHLGRLEPAREQLDRAATLATVDTVQSRAVFAAAEAHVAFIEGKPRTALEAATRAVDESLGGGIEVAHEAVRTALPMAVDAAVAIGDLEEAIRLLDLLADRPPGEVPPFLRAQIRRGRALVAAARHEDPGVLDDLAAAEQTFRDCSYAYWTGRILLDRAVYLQATGSLAEARDPATEAAGIFEQLGCAQLAAKARGILTADLSLR